MQISSDWGKVHLAIIEIECGSAGDIAKHHVFIPITIDISDSEPAAIAGIDVGAGGISGGDMGEFVANEIGAARCCVGSKWRVCQCGCGNRRRGGDCDILRTTTCHKQ